MNTMIKKFVFVLLLALAGVQNAFALACEGTVRFKPPETWGSVYIFVQGQFVQVKNKNAAGWYEIDASDKSTESYADRFGLTNASNFGYATEWIDRKNFNIADGYSHGEEFTCSDLAGGDIYIFEDPATPGKTVVSSNPPNAKYFFVMIPPDMEEWMAAVPMVSMDGGVTGKPMTAVPDMCGWYSYVFWNENITDDVVLYRDDAGIDPVTGLREDMIGVNGNWEESGAAQPIPLGMIFGIGMDSVFFVPDEEQKTNDAGWYYSAAEIDGIEGTCSYSLAAIIYDTDASLHPSFSCYVDGGMGVSSGDCQAGAQGVDATTAVAAVNACIGVTPGLVESTLDPKTKKPKMTKAGAKCFIEEKFFNQLFNYSEGVNEKSCYDMPFHRSNDGKWEFDSDYFTSPGLTVQGGFYPVETSTEQTVLMADPDQVPVAAARNKRPAQGPASLYSWLRQVDPAEGVPIFDLMCNGPGWNGGLDCSGYFASGNDWNGTIYRGTEIDEIYCWGSYCLSQTPADWPTFKEKSETPVARTADYATPRWESGSVSSRTVSLTGGRNQHFCFESHAKFTHKPGLRFSFRGDDDIWVYIDNKLAVDLGGTHMAAPAYVDLDKFEGLSGKLNIGNQYDIDIFFCDRRTTMSNVRIKTNMYIRQKSAIDLKKTVNEKGEASYSVCYTRTGDGSCAAAMGALAEIDSACDSKIVELGVDVSYTLVEGKSLDDAPVKGFENVSTPGTYKCGIDLTNITSPKLDVSKVCLNPGRYSLFMNIDGKSEKVSTFRIASGNVDVVYRDALIKDANEETIGTLPQQTTALGGELVPVYISSIYEENDTLKVYPQDVQGMVYTLSYSDLMDVFYKNAEGELVAVASGQQRKIGASGIDTVYVTVAMANLTEPIQTFKIKVSGRSIPLSISFYLPKLAFVSSPDLKSAEKVNGQSPEVDGTYEEYWTGSVYELYAAILKPDANGKYDFCQQECDGIQIYKGAETSPKIEFVSDTVTFKNGVATISVRALKAYRYDLDPDFNNPATIAIEYNGVVSEKYTPMYFRQSPVPIPVMADVFDVRGAVPAKEYKIPEPYFSMEYEYLDGIADSVAIYYDRVLHRDSLPTKVCILWDSASAKKYDAYKDGFSSMPKDTLVYCNELMSVNENNIDCSAGKNGYCSRVVTFGGLSLSKDVKTAGVGKVFAYAKFEDKGRTVQQGFVGSLTDRIAPVPLKAELYNMDAKGQTKDLDSLVLTLSEPVVLKMESKKRVSLGLYKLETERYVTKEMESELDPSITTDGTYGKVRFVYNSKKIAPQVGDYVRLMADLDKVYWADEVTLSGKDTLRAKTDADYHWNSPTAYNEILRLPSPWVPVVKVNKSSNGDGKKPEDGDGNDDDVEFAEPSFRLKMVGPFQFAIVFEESAPALKKTYAVMDLQGRVVQQGRITSAETLVPALGSGSYVVRIGIAMRRVNIR